jgi:hypothetical protein
MIFSPLFATVNDISSPSLYQHIIFIHYLPATAHNLQPSSLQQHKVFRPHPATTFSIVATFSSASSQ